MRREKGRIIGRQNNIRMPERRRRKRRLSLRPQQCFREGTEFDGRQRIVFKICNGIAACCKVACGKTCVKRGLQAGTARKEGFNGVLSAESLLNNVAA